MKKGTRGSGPVAAGKSGDVILPRRGEVRKKKKHGLIYIGPDIPPGEGRPWSPYFDEEDIYETEPPY